MRFNLLSSGVVGVMALICLLTPSIGAALAGFVLVFASTTTSELLFMVRRFVGLEQSMVRWTENRNIQISDSCVQVALERVKEYSELAREPPEFVEPRPPASWPSAGAIRCEDLVIRYAVRLTPPLETPLR